MESGWQWNPRGCPGLFGMKECSRNITLCRLQPNKRCHWFDMKSYEMQETPPSAFRFLILLSCHFNYQASIIDWCIVTHNLFVHQDVDSGDNWFLCIIPRRESNSSILVCNLFLSLKLIKFKCIVSQIGCSAIIYTSYIASYIYHTITVLVPLGKNMFYCTSCPRAIYQARATLWWKYLSLKYRSRGTLYRIGSLQTDNKVSLISQVTAHCLYICITW